MSAKGTDIKRVRELYAVIQETKERLAHLNLTKEDFLSDETVGGRLAADGLLMCVLGLPKRPGPCRRRRGRRIRLSTGPA